MKKYYLVFSLLILTSISMVAQTPQISNGDFENWTTILIKSLQDYIDAGDEGSLDNIFQMTDDVSGQYSVKLQTTEDNSGDLDIGYFINFDPDHDFRGGVPYTSHVDSICGYYKAQLVAQDSALFLAIFKKNSVPIGGQVFKFAADKNTDQWTRFCYPSHMSSGIVPDSLMLGAASSNAIEEIGVENGSWIQFDSIFFKNGDQLAPFPPNHSFENWDIRNIDFPDDFDTTIKWDINTNPLTIEKTSDASHGNYAVVINTVVNQEQDTIYGVLTNGVMDRWPFSGGIHTTEAPIGISWDYKVHYAGFHSYDPNIVLNLRLNGQNVETYGNSYQQMVNTYQHEYIPINASIVPDTLQFVASSGGYPGNKLWVDNVVLYYNSGNIGDLNIQKMVAFPVPTNDQLNFKISAIKPDEVHITIMELSGKIIKKQWYKLHSGENLISINTAGLPAGSYIYQINNEKGRIIRQFLKK